MVNLLYKNLSTENSIGLPSEVNTAFNNEMHLHINREPDYVPSFCGIQACSSKATSST